MKIIFDRQKERSAHANIILTLTVFFTDNLYEGLQQRDRRDESIGKDAGTVTKTGGNKYASVPDVGPLSGEH